MVEIISQQNLDDHNDLVIFPEEMDFLDFNKKTFTTWAFLRILKSPFILMLSKSNPSPSSGKRDYSKIRFSHFVSHATRYFRASNGKLDDVLSSIILSYKKQLKQENALFLGLKRVNSPKGLDAIQSPSKKIFIIRHPVSNFSSYKKYLSKKSRPLSIEKFIDSWSSYIEQWITLSHNKSGYKTICYEQLLDAPSETMKGVCEFLGITYSDKLLSPTRAGGLWAGNSSSNKEFDKIDSSPRDRLKDISDSERKEITELASKEIEKLRIKYPESETCKLIETYFSL